MKILPIHGNVHCSHALVCNHPKTALMSSYLVLFFSLCKWQKFYLRFLHNPNLPSLPNTRLGPNWLASLVRAPCFMNMILWSLHGSLIESPFLGDAAPFYYLNLKGNWWRFFIYIQNYAGCWLEFHFMAPALPRRLVVEVKLFLFVWPNHAGSKKIGAVQDNPCISNLSFFSSSQH